MGNWSDNDRNAAAERELDNDLDHYFESEGAQTDQAFVVSIDVRVIATSKDEAKRIALLCVESHAVLSDAVVMECLSENEV